MKFKSLSIMHTPILWTVPIESIITFTNFKGLSLDPFCKFAASGKQMIKGQIHLSRWSNNNNQCCKKEKWKMNQKEFKGKWFPVITLLSVPNVAFTSTKITLSSVTKVIKSKPAGSVHYVWYQRTPQLKMLNSSSRKIGYSCKKLWASNQSITSNTWKIHQ